MKAVASKLLLIYLETQVTARLKQCHSVIEKNICFVAFVIQKYSADFRVFRCARNNHKILPGSKDHTIILISELLFKRIS